MTKGSRSGFTLIELSIVLVVIGLIVGGVLVGQDLIRAAGVRATITQIEKFNTAANTFFGKYGYLPGDIPAAPAAQFGFAARGTQPGEGDGNGIIQGSDGVNYGCGTCEGFGETLMFWVDLSTAGIIDGSFSTASSTTAISGGTSTNVGAYLPQAKLGKGNYIYAWSATPSSGGFALGGNAFGFSGVSSIGDGGVGASTSLTVQEAYNIDKKTDDGLPQTGRVVAYYLNASNGAEWAAGGGNAGAYPTAQTPGSATTCYDNSNTWNATMQYSLAQNNGNGVNCALSFQMQGAGR